MLYRQIVGFLKEEKIADRFEIAFITINSGIVTLSNSYIAKENNNVAMKQYSNLPPKHFRSGRSWVSKEQIDQMANGIVEYVSNVKGQMSVVAYCRGAYLEAVRLASQKSGIEIKEIFSDDELAQLKKKGIMWMKVGLRMPTAFIVFRMKIREFVKECKREPKQLKLPF